MKFVMKVRRLSDGKVWEEKYTKPVGDAEVWCRATIEEFNKTLRPEESAREFVSVYVLDEEAGEPRVNIDNIDTITKINNDAQDKEDHYTREMYEDDDDDLDEDEDYYDDEEEWESSDDDEDDL